MEAPVLALIPSGVKAGKVYSVLPNNSNGDFTFTRASEGTRIDENGLIDNQGSGIPRLDWGDGDCPSLLLEPQRTNEIIWSENFTQWGTFSLTVSPGQITSPDGGLNSYKILEAAVNFYHFTYSNAITYPNAVTYSYSVFVKKLGRQYVGVQTLVNTDTGAVALFDLDTGSVAYTFQHGGHTVANAKIENYGNDWYRISAVFTGIAGQSLFFGLVTADSLWLSGTAYNNPYLGDVNKGVYAFGAQAEAGIYASSYIGTKGASVTRLKDKCIDAGNASLFSIAEGSLFLDAYIPNNPSTTILSLSDGTDSQKIQLNFEAQNSRIRTYSSGGVLYYNTLSFNQRSKILITFKLNQYKTYINGFLVNTDTNASIPTGMDRFTFASVNSLSLFFEGNVYDTRVYDKALTEAEAIELTTL